MGDVGDWVLPFLLLTGESDFLLREPWFILGGGNWEVGDGVWLFFLFLYTREFNSMLSWKYYMQSKFIYFLKQFISNHST